jgi:small redox-active disulfide protein 2
MLRIKVLGPGCRNCQLVTQNAAEALEVIAEQQPNGLDATIQKVTQAEEIMKYSILFTPGLVINEQLVCAGRVPSVGEIKGWLARALAGNRSESSHTAAKVNSDLPGGW